MRKYLLLSLMALLPITALITVTSCSGDDEVVQPPVDNNANNDKDGSSGNNGENLDIHVVVNDDGTTSNGSIFSAIDNQNFYVDYIKYTVTEGHLAVSGYDKTGFKGIAKIISKLTYKGNTYEVLEIKESSFRDCTSLTSVTIGSGVTSIGERAFYGCSNLTSVTIPNSVTSIGSSAFYDCSGLTAVHINDIAAWCKNGFSNSSSNPLYYAKHLYLNSEEIKDLTIPESVTSIGNYAFESCRSLTSITIPNSVTSIGSSAFCLCSSLTSITIPNSVTSIGDEAFRWCSNLTSITIPNSVTSIGSSAFYGCRSLTSITIPNSVTSIGSSAFYDCTGLTAVHINDIAAWCKNVLSDSSSNPLYYAKHLYLNGEEIKDLTIPESVTSIGDYAFDGCTSLTSVTIPNCVTSIGKYAFFYCTSLTSITIGSGVTSIGNSAFSGCSSLTSIIVDSGNTVYDSRNNCNAIIGTATNTLIGGCKNTTIPNSVTSIGNFAFSNCSSLTSIIIPSSVTSIGYLAFYKCSSLTSVTIGSGVTSIGYDAFSSCQSLTDVYCYAENVPSTYYDAFENSSISSATLHVPARSVNSYKSQYPWSSFGSIVAIE